MTNTVLAYTSSGVESVAVIDQDSLAALATWLCYEKEYHYPIEQGRSHKATDVEFERQVKKNGGYCDLCKDFAGEILSHFELVPKGAK